MKKLINPSDTPKAIGTYNQGIETNGFIFTSGQIGMDRNSGKIVDGGINAQIEQVLENINAILCAVDLDKTAIVKLTVFLVDFDDFPSINKGFENFFGDIDYPARSTVEVSQLPMGALVEIDCIASRT